MAQTSRYLFNPRQSDEFVGEILYRRQGTTEFDFDLYLDRDTRTYFVVGSVSHQYGPVLQNNHTRYTVDEFLASHPGHRRRIAEIQRGRVTPR
jgi:hypothetical protein